MLYADCMCRLDRGRRELRKLGYLCLTVYLSYLTS